MLIEKLSIIVPCFNEEGVIAQTAREIKKYAEEITETFEIIFVDDGSSDKTLEQLRILSKEDSRFCYISFSRNFGKESAMLAGLEKSTGECVHCDYGCRFTASTGAFESYGTEIL